jgi:type III secretory pathway component EscR
MTLLWIPLVLGVILVVSVLVIIPQLRDSDNKTQAHKILELRNTEYSCNELKNMYLEQYEKRHNSPNNLQWYREITDKLSEQCVDRKQLMAIESIEVCIDSTYVGCEIHKIENPELYKDFNFRTAVKNLKPLNDSEGQQ